MLTLNYPPSPTISAPLRSISHPAGFLDTYFDSQTGNPNSNFYAVFSEKSTCPNEQIKNAYASLADLEPAKSALLPIFEDASRKYIRLIKSGMESVFYGINGSVDATLKAKVFFHLTRSSQDEKLKQETREDLSALVDQLDEESLYDGLQQEEVKNFKIDLRDIHWNTVVVFSNEGFSDSDDSPECRNNLSPRVQTPICHALVWCLFIVSWTLYLARPPY